MNLRKLIATVIASVTLGGVAGNTAQAKSKYFVPGWFQNEAICIHHNEASDWHYGPNRHYGYIYWNGYYNGLQFTIGTWERANTLLHRNDDPQWSSPYIQILHAYVIYENDGGSWREWPNSSRECGYR